MPEATLNLSALLRSLHRAATTASEKCPQELRPDAERIRDGLWQFNYGLSNRTAGLVAVV